MGDLSEHFSRIEFACPHCGESFVRPRLVQLLERIRVHVGKPLHIVSGYRCPIHNRAAGGAKESQHVMGAAADIPAGYAQLALVISAGAVGVGTKDGQPIHVDVRDGGPARWVY